MKKIVIAMACFLCAVLLCACGGKSFVRSPMDADVSFAPTVYYGEDGVISFLYDDTRDAVSVMTGDGQSIVAVYEGEHYSMVISYEETQKARKEADAEIARDFVGVILLSGESGRAEISGYAFRRAEITAEDGSRGAVLYGNTANGYARIYYLVSVNAREGTWEHVEEILSTVTFGAHEVLG